MPIGQIPIDAIFSPIVKVNDTVQQARIEQITNYDLLMLEIWTDGTMRPGRALSESAKILMQHISPLADFAESEMQVVEQVETLASGAGRFDEVPIEDLELTMRAYNCLKRAGITTVGDILERIERGAGEMLAIRNFGQKSLTELIDKMKEKGFLSQSFEVEP